MSLHPPEAATPPGILLAQAIEAPIEAVGDYLVLDVDSLLVAVARARAQNPHAAQKILIPVPQSRVSSHTEAPDEAIPAGETGQYVFHGGRVVVNPAERRVYVEGSPVRLTPIQYGIAEALGSTPGKVWARLQLLEHVWGDTFRDVRGVNVQVGRLRRAIGEQAIECARSFGYYAVK